MSKSGLRFSAVFFAALCIMGAAGTLFAQVDQGELERNLTNVTFINYEGPHARIETREQIRQIGVGLGQAIRRGAARTGGTGRYFVIHSVSAPEGDKLDADIFGLGVDVGVDHIRNLRTIIQGYLQEAYGYSAGDAALLAEYTTIYNAVYRGNWDYFTGRYKTPVIENLSRERAGLSIRYDEWPGRTLLLIPLGIGGLSSVDTSVVSDDRVIEELRREDDRGVEQRQEMVEFKEREAAEAEQRAQVEREAIREEEQRVAEEREQVTQEREQIAQERDEDDQAAQEEPDRREQEADQKTVELDRREQEVDQKAAELDQREQALEERREEARQLEDFAEQKTEEARQERESIAQDQQELIDQGDRDGVIGAMLESPNATVGRLVRLNPATGEELKRSPLNTVSIRTLTFLNGKILAIAGENRGGGVVRLVEINPGSLEMAKQGDDDMHPASLLWVNGNDIYAITVNSSGLNLGRFDANLSLQAKSAITVHPNASVTIQKGSLLTQRADGSAAILNPGDLTEIGK